jgi:cytochrome c oxidase assembly protein subunit 15
LKLAKERGLLTPWNATQGLKALAAATAAALLVQIALGGWVSTNYAVLACTEFPKCHGSWWPDMNFVQGFEVWRELGKLQSGESVSFQALTAIHYTHRLMAYLVFALFIALGWQLTRQVQSRRLGQLLWALAAWQLISGLSNVVLGWPLIAALAHSAGAAAMALVMTDVVFRIRAEVRT